MTTLIFWLFGFIPTFFIYLLLSVGIILYVFSEVATVSLAKYITSSFLTSSAVKVVSIGIMSLSLFLLGVSYSSQAFKEEIDKRNAEIQKINNEAKNISQQVVIKYVTQDKIIKEKGNEIIKYVNTKNDADCNLHNSTIELLNSAAKNNLPDPTRAIDATSAGINFSTVEKIIIENYNKYYELKNNNDSLQEWIIKQQKNNE